MIYGHHLVSMWQLQERIIGGRRTNSRVKTAYQSTTLTLRSFPARTTVSSAVWPGVEGVDETSELLGSRHLGAVDGSDHVTAG